METYLQTAWGDQWDNVDMDIVRTAIKGTKEMDDEHGAFWVGLVKNEENVLEVHKDLTLFGVFEDEPGVQYKGRAKDWNEVEALFQALLSEKIMILKSRLTRGEQK
jgi:hypothetical protein